MVKTSLGLQIEDLRLQIAGRGKSLFVPELDSGTPAAARLQSRPGGATVATAQNGWNGSLQPLRKLLSAATGRCALSN